MTQEQFALLLLVRRAQVDRWERGVQRMNWRSRLRWHQVTKEPWVVDRLRAAGVDVSAPTAP